MPRNSGDLFVGSGFPCRFERCEERFQVADGSSMASIHEASDERTRHELLVHGLVIAAYVPKEGKTAWISRTHSPRALRQ